MLNADPNRRPARRWAPAAAIVMMGSVAVISAGFEPGTAPRAPRAADVSLTAAQVVVTPIAVDRVAVEPIVIEPVVPAPNRPAQAPSAAPVEAAAAQAAPAGQTLVFGRVYDPSGAVLPGVEVVLTRSNGAEERRAVSDGSGYYQFDNVAAGDHVVAMNLPGFRTGRGAVVVPPSGTVEFSVNLQIGSLEETITVTGQRTNPFAPSRQRQVTAQPRPEPPLQRRLTSTNVTARPPGTPVRVGGAIKVPVKLVDVRPVYPAAAQAAGLEGVVILEATIAPDGTTRDITVLRALEPDLNAAAVDAVGGWRFTPTLLNGVEVPVIMTVTVQFRLE